ncbi:hypothetical protein FB45DRAFT_942374 [Roridomyces roridus]|uniref:Anti-proliferative protein domain-containing protein n=1 Tax=Roridomyces roridus TaxID=1738132 RepID=A0AAD7F9E3_9AGAR|nr:hypothetical protein FB45DRAFT_942374 [Roridomyces roridus]
MSSFTSTTTTITHLVSFLTRPLMRAHAPKTILALQRHLLAAFTAPDFVATEFLLSADCPPPPTLQVACLVSGIRWAEWIRLLSAGLDLRVILKPTELVVELGTRRLVRVASSAVDGVKSVTDAPRPRSAAINPTRVPSSLSSCYSASDDEDDSDSEFESESDAESDSGHSSVSSATSVENVCAKPLPILRPTPFLLRRPTAAKATQAAAQRYLYDGGVTQVLSGGVMLGSAAPTPKRAAPAPALPKLRILSARPAPALRGSLAGGVQRKTAPDAAMTWRRAL